MTEEKAKAGKRVKFSEHVPEVEVPDKWKPPSCNRCDTLACWPKSPEDTLKGPDFCATKNYPDVVKEAKQIYLKEGFDRKLQLAGAVLEGMSSMTPPGGREINMKLSRLEEIAVFCKLMDYQKLGFAHCIGCIGEARELSDFFQARGFETYQVCCKVGGIEKGEIGIEGLGTTRWRLCTTGLPTLQLLLRSAGQGYFRDWRQIGGQKGKDRPD